MIEHKVGFGDTPATMLLFGLLNSLGTYVTSFIVTILTGFTTSPYFQLMCLFISCTFGFVSTMSAVYFKYKLEQRQKKLDAQAKEKEKEKRLEQ